MEPFIIVVKQGLSVQCPLLVFGCGGIGLQMLHRLFCWWKFTLGLTSKYVVIVRVLCRRAEREFWPTYCLPIVIVACMSSGPSSDFRLRDSCDGRLFRFDSAKKFLVSFACDGRTADDVVFRPSMTSLQYAASFQSPRTAAPPV